MSKLRLRFTKTGKAVYISHLDLMRTMQRVFLRAGYSLKYSEGYNPHAQISILLPLSVGCSSCCELMDFQLTDENMSLAEMPERLSRACPEGIRALEVYEEGRKVRELKWLKISGRLEYDSRSAKDVLPALESFFAGDEIIIEKKTKRGVGQFDIVPAIKNISFSEDDDCVRMEAVISAQEPTLNPEHIVSALRQLAPELAPDFAEFERLELFDENMEIFR